MPFPPWLLYRRWDGVDARVTFNSKACCFRNSANLRSFLAVLTPKGCDWNRPTPSMQLSEASADSAVEWFNPNTSKIRDGGVVRSGRVDSLLAPFAGAAVLYLKSR